MACQGILVVNHGAVRASKGQDPLNGSRESIQACRNVPDLKEDFMSVTRPDGTKITLPRSGADEFWRLIGENFAQCDERKWRYLAMLALRENAGWPLEQIGKVFGHPKGHVTRCLSRIKDELRSSFDAAPEFLDLPDTDHE